MIKECAHCKKEFRTHPYCIKKGQGKYCSRKCAGEHLKNRKTTICKSCSIPFTRKISKAGMYCSNRCRFEDYVPKNKGKRASLETRKKLSKAFKGRKSPFKGKKRPEMAGKNHPLWIEDRSRLAKYKDGNEYRNSPASRNWAKEVKERDGWICQLKNSSCSGKVIAHHVLSWKDYPELRYTLNNGITLCHAHHPRVRTEEKRLESIFKKLVSVSND